MIRRDASPAELAGGDRDGGHDRGRCCATTWPASTARRGGWPAAASGGLDLLAWGQKYLPEHFRRPPSNMHRWLAEQLDAAHTARGTKLNVLGPRGGAKSTIGTLCLPLRAAVECWEPYIWIVSDTKHQACAHLENIKAELLDNRRLAEDFPDGRRAGAGVAGQPRSCSATA